MDDIPCHDVGLVVAAAGSGSRFGGNDNKLFVPLANHPLFLHCLLTFVPLMPSGHTVLVVPRQDRRRFADALADARLADAVRIVIGGTCRQDSVLKGVHALPPEAHVVAVHDAARPLATAALLKQCVAAVRIHGSGVAARQVTDTIKQVDNGSRVTETLERACLRATETPQVFLRDALQKALEYCRTHDIPVTDEAGALEAVGKTVYLVESLHNNVKITYPDDVHVARALLAASSHPLQPNAASTNNGP